MVLFIVDGNWYFNRALHTVRGTENVGYKLALQILSMITKDALAVKATHLCVAFDGKENFRYKVYKEYKASRKDKPNDPKKPHIDNSNRYEHLATVQKLLTDAGVLWLQPLHYEADDLLASIADQLKDEVDIVLGSSDKDTYQVLDTNVVMYDSAFKPQPRYITKAVAEARKGCKVSQMVDYQTLLGDNTDGVPGFPSYGPKTIEALLAKYKSIKNWYAKGSKEEKQWLLKNKVALVRNKKLVHLVRDLPTPELKEMKLKKIRPDERFPTAWHAYYNFVHSTRKKLF